MAHYAIVDSAQRPRFHERLERLRAPYRSLFDGTAEQSMTDIAPLLLEHAGDLLDGSPLSRELRTLGECKPAVTFIVSDESLEALAAHFRDFHLIRVPEPSGRTMLLRWYDTRILPAWIRVVRPDQQAAFARPVMEWHYYDRFGDIRQLQLSAPLTEGFPALPPLSLDTASTTTSWTLHGGCSHRPAAQDHSGRDAAGALPDPVPIHQQAPVRLEGPWRDHA